MTRILVLYATTDGHTEKIATAIANTLTGRGYDVDRVQAGTLDTSPARFSAIVVAAPVHAGRYPVAIAEWIRAHVAQFGDKPTAFVSVCLAVLQHDPKVDAELDAIVHRFIDPLAWRPAVVKQVAGALQYTRYNFFVRWMMRRIAAKAGGDTDTTRDYEYTDWPDLKSFAEAFGDRVAEFERSGTRRSA